MSRPDDASGGLSIEEDATSGSCSCIGCFSITGLFLFGIDENLLKNFGRTFCSFNVDVLLSTPYSLTIYCLFKLQKGRFAYLLLLR